MNCCDVRAPDGTIDPVNEVPRRKASVRHGNVAEMGYFVMDDATATFVHHYRLGRRSVQTSAFLERVLFRGHCRMNPCDANKTTARLPPHSYTIDSVHTVSMLQGFHVGFSPRDKSVRLVTHALFTDPRQRVLFRGHRCMNNCCNANKTTARSLPQSHTIDSGQRVELSASQGFHVGFSRRENRCARSRMHAIFTDRRRTAFINQVAPRWIFIVIIKCGRSFGDVSEPPCHLRQNSMLVGIGWTF